MICKYIKTSIDKLPTSRIILLLMFILVSIPTTRSQENQDDISVLVDSVSGDIAAILPIQDMITDITVESLQRGCDIRISSMN